MQSADRAGRDRIFSEFFRCNDRASGVENAQETAVALREETNPGGLLVARNLPCEKRYWFRFELWET